MRQNLKRAVLRSAARYRAYQPYRMPMSTKAKKRPAKSQPTQPKKTARNHRPTAEAFKAWSASNVGRYTVMCLIAAVIITAICLAASQSGTPSSKGTGDSGQPLSELISQITCDYDGKLSEAINSSSYDILKATGSRASWKEVLAIYAVKTGTELSKKKNPALPDDKANMLSTIFWEMNELSTQVETVTTPITVESVDGNGSLVKQESSVEQTTLYITVSHRTAEDMAETYSFTDTQKQQLTELLDGDNDSLWAALLYGIPGSAEELVAVSASQLGNMGGRPYWSWYGFSTRVAWCACFVSWCANECGYIDSGVIPQFDVVSSGVSWFKERGLWKERGYTPSPGNIIFFDWENDGSPDHVGIVEKCENGTVYTIEGNSDDRCKENTYEIDSEKICGYGLPAC